MTCKVMAQAVAQPIERNETKDVNNEMQYARPIKDIPGPKALPLLGNWFRFLTYNIDKSSLVKVCFKKHASRFLFLFLSLLKYLNSFQT